MRRNALYGGSVDGHQQLQVVPPEYSQELEMLLGLPHCHCHVVCSGKVLSDLQSQVTNRVDPVHSVPIYVQWGGGPTLLFLKSRLISFVLWCSDGGCSPNTIVLVCLPPLCSQIYHSFNSIL